MAESLSKIKVNSSNLGIVAIDLRLRTLFDFTIIIRFSL